jgi:hypothetical protein
MEDNQSNVDELDEISIHEVFFQFGEDEPIKFAYVAGGEFSLTLAAVETENPQVVFSDGKGNEFKLFLKKSEDGIQ